MRFSHVDLAGPIATLTLGRSGGARTLEIILFSKSVAAELWASLNVVNRVAEGDDLRAVVARWANRLASRRRGVHAAARELLRVRSDDGQRGVTVLFDLSMPLFEKAEAQQRLRPAVRALQAGPPGSGSNFPEKA